ATMANESEWSRGRAALAIEWEQRPGRVEWTAAWIPGRAHALRPALRRAHVRQPGAAPSKVVRGCAAARQMPTSSRKGREKCRAAGRAKARAAVAAPAEAWAAPGRRRQSASLTNRKKAREALAARAFFKRSFIVFCFDVTRKHSRRRRQDSARLDPRARFERIEGTRA